MWHNLKTTLARFPDETNYDESSLDGILISHVLSFLSTQEILQGACKVFHWLKPGKKLFVINYTPFHKTLKAFIPLFEKRKSEGCEFPGMVDDRSKFCKPGTLTENLPKGFILFDVDTLSKIFRDAGFIIDECNYVGSDVESIPKKFILDGREWVGLIATKP